MKNMVNKPVSVKLKIGIGKHGKTMLEKEGSTWICGKDRKVQEVGVTVQYLCRKREEMIHVSRWKGQRCEGFRI